MINKKIVFLIVTVFFVIILSGCDFLQEEDETVSISKRIELFQSDLNNSNYSGLDDNFHPDMISFDNYQDSTVISSGPLQISNAPFTFGSPSVSDTNTSGEKRAEGSFENDLGATGTYDAIMKEDGDENWKILEITITIGSSDYTLRTIAN